MTGGALAIEIRERYRDVVRDRWPVSVDPQPDELLSSWLHRLALANGIAPRSFASALGLGEGMWSPRLDLQLPREAAALLADRTNVRQETISAMAMTEPALTPLLLPLRENVHRNRSSWMQYCPLCLASDEAPYFRRRWRLASRISCSAHGCGLRDRCPACRTAIVSFDQVELALSISAHGAASICGLPQRQGSTRPHVGWNARSRIYAGWNRQRIRRQPSMLSRACYAHPSSPISAWGEPLRISRPPHAFAASISSRQNVWTGL